MHSNWSKTWVGTMHFVKKKKVEEEVEVEEEVVKT